ncbi:hypothetical protein NQ317_001805 [Molorchus minor]|uniref:Polycystin domain-containing protein n=1 Tax=Molorchus minor TaxID=1323400 RepID=A0ABQ9JVW6_9CUCU|nr:hypothetical protein NQ317_001805 [Molorchus minor]
MRHELQEPQKKLRAARRGKKHKKPFWITKAMAESFGREDILRATLRDTIIYLLFVVLITTYALEIRRRVAFYLTKALTQQFIERPFETMNGAEIPFSDIRTASDFWHFVEGHLIGSFFWESTYGDNAEASANEDEMNILYDNKVLGVPRMRQVKVLNDTCAVHEFFQRLFATCYDQYSEEEEDKTPFGVGTGTA